MLESCPRLPVAVKVEPSAGVADVSERVSVVNGPSVRVCVPVDAASAVSHPGPVAAALQPHQLSVATTVEY